MLSTKQILQTVFMKSSGASMVCSRTLQFGQGWLGFGEVLSAASLKICADLAEMSKSPFPICDLLTTGCSWSADHSEPMHCTSQHATHTAPEHRTQAEGSASCPESLPQQNALRLSAVLASSWPQGHLLPQGSELEPLQVTVAQKMLI